jgi:CDP-diacylglycerol--glycerol-3-phosphate 3-phosphatidyltransferase
MANLITLARFPVLLVIVLLLYSVNPVARLAGVILIGVLIGLDCVDGVVARARHETSLMGSVLDVMVDRAVELVLWTVYAHLGLIPVAIPIIYILRGTVVDSLRGMKVSQGTAPLKAASSRWGQFLMHSPWMRTPYALTKLAAFAGLGLAHALAAYAAQGMVTPQTVRSVTLTFNVVSWLSVAFCLVRGAPVVVEALPSLTGSADPR